MSTSHIILLVCCTLVCLASAALCYWSISVLREVGDDVQKYLNTRINKAPPQPAAGETPATAAANTEKP